MNLLTEIRREFHQQGLFGALTQLNVTSPYTQITELMAELSETDERV